MSFFAGGGRSAAFMKLSELGKDFYCSRRMWRGRRRGLVITFRLRRGNVRLESGIFRFDDIEC